MPPRRNVPAGDSNDVSAMDRMAMAMEQMAEFMMAQQVHNQAQVQPRVDVTKAIAARQPPFYAGEEDPVILEEWIRTFDKLLNAVNCPEVQRVSSAVYYLTKVADNWWATVGPDLLQDPEFGWEEFKAELRGQFYSERIKGIKCEEFLRLERIKGIKCEEFLRLKQQGTTVQDYHDKYVELRTTVQDYHDKYVELMRFAQDIVPDEPSKARRFVRGLDWGVRSAIAPFMCSTLREAYNRASDHYQVYLDQQAVYGRSKRKAEDRRGKSQWENKRLNQGGINPRQGERKGGITPRKQSGCLKCGRNHPGETCQGVKIICYKCGLLGHKAYECPTRVEDYQNRSQNANQRRGSTETNGQKPMVPGNRGVNSQQVNRGRLPKATAGSSNKGKAPMGENNTGNQGRIYVVNSAQAQASDVVSGTFPINSMLGLVLFDTGATNSFISSTFADKLKLRSIIKLDLNVKTAFGIVVACKEGYDNVSIEIAGFNCPGNLIRFELEGIDVVLGIDWLNKYKAQIRCDERKVVLRGPKGKKISYRGTEKPPEPKLMTTQKLKNGE
ncbi:uncharacterized protein LOC116013224 [Ipomoea triloba]|uniref:uncharacterized protein LOC116013224 n=1 Tax=Ipomoea triloba TaxID=35885 RepID=UPI00125CD56B|nr:uncharacterized protein LOC116013224 [Ipomoea triloba]